MRVTSRTEGSHGILKRLLKNRLIDLNTLLLAINETLSRLQNNYNANYQEQTSKKVKKYNHKVMRRLLYLIGFAGLELIKKQLDIAMYTKKENRQ